MSRAVYIIRHGKSEGTRHNEASFGPQGSTLNEEGIQEAKELQSQLERLGIDVTAEPVAASQKKRAYETAKYAGFKEIKQYPSLNEVGGDLLPEVLDAMIERREVPPSAVAVARKLLHNPPTENVWVTHGQLIAGIAHELGIAPSKLFIPKMGSITKLVLP